MHKDMKTNPEFTSAKHIEQVSKQQYTSNRLDPLLSCGTSGYGGVGFEVPPSHNLAGALSYTLISFSSLCLCNVVVCPPN